MAQVSTAPPPEGFGATMRRDAWWVAPLATFLGLLAFLIYANAIVFFVPGYFDFVALRSPAHNVAYWNLPQRVLHQQGGLWFVGDEPLVFFHFSGYQPDRPWAVSKHLGPEARVLLHQIVETGHVGTDWVASSQLPAQHRVQFARLLRDMLALADAEEARRSASG